MTTTTVISHCHTINYNPIEFIDGMPAAYLLLKLRQHGEEHFNNISTADTELHVEGIDTPFWVHKDYLVLQSPYFREIFETTRSQNNLIRIDIPSPENFAPLLEYLYTGDGEKWYDSMNSDNFCDVWTIVNLLRLGSEAQAICSAYYQNEFIVSEEN